MTITGAHLKKTQTSEEVVFTGILESAGIVLTIDKTAGTISLHQTVAPAMMPVDRDTWQQVVAQIELDNVVT